MRRGLATVTLLLGLGLGAAYAAGAFGGSTTSSSSAHRPTSPPSLRTDLRLAKNVRCRGAYRHLVGPRVFSRFHAVTAVSCSEGFRVFPGQGQWEVVVRKVATGGVPAFQRYFEQPDEPNFPPKNAVCTANYEGLLVPVFVDGRGRTLVPRTPVDGCGHPLGLPRGEKSIRVRWHDVRVRRIKQVISAAAVAANCPMKWGNSVAWAGPPRDSTAGRPLFTVAPRTVRVCVFRTPPNRFAVGRFVRGFRLDASRTRRLLHALTGGGPGRGCAKQRNFAVVIASAGSAANVELGGCWRVDRPDRLAGTANRGVVRAILG
ncbi:MAG TPA: hypothetical protein VJ716_00910 [Gaiellaceae bacterium]|nr:hypothetical protein [Gaiellaceae bacterium]